MSIVSNLPFVGLANGNAMFASNIRLSVWQQIEPLSMFPDPLFTPEGLPPGGILNGFFFFY